MRMRTETKRESTLRLRDLSKDRRIQAVVLLLFVILLLTLLPLPPIAYLPLLVIVVMGVGIVYGRRLGAVFAIVAMAAELIRLHMGLNALSVLLAAMPLIAGLTGGFAGHRLRDTRQAAERAARRAELLSVALIRLPSLASTNAIYRELPRLLSEILGFTHADVLVPSPDASCLLVETSLGWTPPPDVRMPLQSVTGRAFLRGETQHVPNTAEDADYVEGAGLGPIHAELALPIFAYGAVVAVLNLERAKAGPFAPEEISSLQGLVRAVGSAIEGVERLQRAHEVAHTQDFLLDFSRQIADAGPPESLARRALTLLLPRIGADAGYLWQPSGRDLNILAEIADGEYAPARTLAQPVQRAPAEPLFVADCVRSPYTAAEQLADGLQSFALIPMLEADGRMHALLEVLYYRQATEFTSVQRQTLLRAAERLNGALQQSSMTTRLASLLDALHGLGSVGDAARLPDLALATALHLIPGTDAATLLTMEDGHLRPAAHLGYGTDIPPHWHLRTAEEALAWYRGDQAAFLRGTPRLENLEDTRRFGGAPRCNLCLPLVHEQRLIGMLNLDSTSRTDAFSRESVSLAETFSMQLSVLLEQMRHRRTLEQVARTDALTGLSNRRSFDERLEAEWKVAQRYGQPLSLVIIDLLGFKSVNDRYGHQAGDLALVAVAQAMAGVRRDGDTIFRWGGDEFAIVLTHAALTGALSAASRYLAAIHAARVLAPDGQTEFDLSANMGVASAPADAETVEGLLKAADERVFHAKRAKLAIYPAPGA